MTALRPSGLLLIHLSKACQYYVASFWLLPVQFNALLPPANLNTSTITALLKQISTSTGAEVVFKSMTFEMHGLEQEVRAAVSMILELDIIKVGVWTPSFWRFAYGWCRLSIMRFVSK